jgi:hypothetical protein
MSGEQVADDLQRLFADDPELVLLSFATDGAFFRPRMSITFRAPPHLSSEDALDAALSVADKATPSTTQATFEVVSRATVEIGGGVAEDIRTVGEVAAEAGRGISEAVPFLTVAVVAIAAVLVLSNLNKIVGAFK